MKIFNDIKLYIYVAASDSTPDMKRKADFVCSGKHDELTIQSAVDMCYKTKKNLFLCNGTYVIEDFYDFSDGGPLTAIRIPNKFRELKIIGENHSNTKYNKNNVGVMIYVPENALNLIGEDSVDILRNEWTPRGLGNGSALRVENMSVTLSNNQHRIRCLDFRRCDRVIVKNMTLSAIGDMNAGLGNPPKPAEIGCIGLTMTDGSNQSYSNYENVVVSGFDEGIQVGGERPTLKNCGAIMCRYGFTFGNYESNCGSNHPITMITCYDERNINLPLFGEWCGDDDIDGNRLKGEQDITMISFSIERFAEQTPGGVLGDCMREVIPGLWKGKIEFGAQPAWNHTNEKNFQLWENDGSGIGIRTVNNIHKKICTTEERLSYYPTYGQEIFDTDLNRMVICIDAENRKWVDFNGNIV